MTIKGAFLMVLNVITIFILSIPICSKNSVLYPLKTSENHKVFWYFQGVEKGCFGNKWVKKQPLEVFWKKKVFLKNSNSERCHRCHPWKILVKKFSFNIVAGSKLSTLLSFFKKNFNRKFQNTYFPDTSQWRLPLLILH